MSKYIKEEVETILKNHKENEAKLTEIRIKQEEYQKRLEYAGTVYEDTPEEVIENMQVSGQSYDTLRSNTNKTTDKVANTALNYEKELTHINKEDREYLTRKLEEFKEEEDILNKKIARVKNLLNRLTKEERLVIEVYYIEEEKWENVEEQYEDEFKKHKTIRKLQTHRDEAIQKMLNILNTRL